MENCVIIIIAVVVLLLFIMMAKTGCKGGMFGIGKQNPAVYNSNLVTNEEYDNINHSLHHLADIGINKNVIDSFLSMGQFLFTGIGYPSYGDAIPAILRATSENIHLAEQLEVAEKKTEKIRDRGFKIQAGVNIGKMLGILDSNNNISITYETARNKFNSLLTSTLQKPLRAKFESKVPAEVRLGLTLFFIQPQVAWQYYLEWINSDKYRKLTTFKEDVFVHEQEEFKDAEEFGDDNFGDAPIQIVPRGGTAISQSEKRILVEYNKQLFFNRLLLFIIWCTSNDNYTIMNRVLLCMINAQKTDHSSFIRRCQDVQNELNALPINNLQMLLQSKPLPDRFSKAIDNALLPGINN